MLEGTSCLIMIFFLRESVCGVGGIGGWNGSKAVVKYFLFISEDFVLV